MSRRLTLGRALRVLSFPAGVAVAVSAASGASGQQPPVFGVETALVRIDVVVLDREGDPVRGLSREDFEVEEDGRVQEIESFEPVVVRGRRESSGEPARLSFGRVRAPSEGRAFIVYFDGTHVSSPAAKNVGGALRRFVETDLRDGDWFTITAPEQGIWWTARDAYEYAQLVPVIGRLRGEYVRDPLRAGMSEWEAMALVEGVASVGARELPQAGPPPSPNPAGGDQQSLVSGQADPWLAANAIYAAARKRIAVTLGSLHQAVTSLVPFRGHKTVFLVSEGFVLAPGMMGYAELIDAARRANVAIYAVDPRGLESGYAADSDAPRLGFGTRRLVEAAGADDLATATGGRSLTVNDPTRALREIARESEVYYLLGFHPDGERGRERKLKVRVHRDGVRVRARTRYFLDLPEKKRELAKPTGGGVGRTPAEREAMRALADTTDLPLRLATLYFEDDGKGSVTTMYATEIRIAAEEPGRRRVSTVAEARPRDGGEALRDEFEEDLRIVPGVPTILSRHWHMPPGVWQARVLVRDEETGRIGTALHTFEVPSPDALRISTPILTTELEEVGGRPRPRVVLSRTFRSGQVLYCQFQVHGAATDPGDRFPKVVSGYELRRGDTVVRVGQATPIKPEWDGRLSRLLGLSLEGATTGSYTLVLRVEDTLTGEALAVTEPFTVAP